MTRGRKPTKPQGSKAKVRIARKSPKNEASRRQALETRLTEALEQQAATSEILSVIGRSPTDAQPVFDMIAERAMRLCGALHAGVLSFDGELVHLVAHVDVSQQFSDVIHRMYPTPPTRRTAGARVILTRATVHIPDVENDPDYEIAAAARTAGFRSTLAVPMLSAGQAVGAIVVLGGKPVPFFEQKIIGQPILIDESTRKGLPDGIRVESHGATQFKTRSQSALVYSVTPGQRP
jgi:hypothetical protein